ncbi:N-methylhydantoinase A/oxoprolinase/acetone carboxylase, beta subunit [Methanococcoides vulcani]|uniref:N-methylhydantoinase A/oxoprolinase/acetone carboxylase, beta subunit n=1 Tax=Methanococcoides vulcani TaxID=1353158 RepID=A0A1I0BMA1_9EURY|nr:hydantoinase/oxoprolinase family protein [Methanococcoides vulcani]SET08083.1 N-methylhydantoinase A/oxoprolinase/acetone carboxylase, beta subunit [Methanococcoides vulcani]
MQYSMGIDAGGTYTDAVIIRDSDGEIIDSNKALTTYPNLLEGIKNALDGVDQNYLQDIKLVSVSTTLSTNTILEGTGYSVALIMAGDYVIPENHSIKNYIVVEGGHGPSGEEIGKLDIEAVREFILQNKDEVSAFAVSSYFSIRNPEHELQIKELIKDMTGLPTVCGHELSQDLGAYNRGITAYLNAQLIPITDHFIETIIGEMDRRNINARLLMLKCDGSVVGIDEAKEKPIESIFSGPAASLVGAAYLSRSKTCTVIDVGGTSTDVSMIENELPELCDEGAVVGGWQTKVKAIRMETSAMGGDSHIWIKNQKPNIGPRRVVPLCVAATKFPSILEKLKMARVPSKMLLSDNIQPTKFFIRSGKEPTSELSASEQEIYDRIGDEPVSINGIFLDKLPSPVFLDLLIQKRLVQAIGFTPTDALHVLGDYNEWNAEASNTAATILGRMTHQNKIEFCQQVKNEVAKNMAIYLMSYLLEDVHPDEIRKVIEGDYHTRFKLDVPVVLLGGPVSAYVEDVRKLIDADVILPEHSEVGNAVGALVGKGIKRIEILIKNVRKKSKISNIVFVQGERKVFMTHPEALEYADQHGRELVLGYMKEAGLDAEDVRIDVTRNDISMFGDSLPLETKLVFVGIGTPKRDI